MFQKFDPVPFDKLPHEGQHIFNAAWRGSLFCGANFEDISLEHKLNLVNSTELMHSQGIDLI